MRSFELKILTPTGVGFSGQVQELYLHTTSGEIGILAGHTDYLAGVVPCAASLTDEAGDILSAFCGGGFLSVVAGEVTLTVDEFAMADALDADAVKAECERLSAELAACDKGKEPEKAQFLKDSLARATAKSKALAEK